MAEQANAQNSPARIRTPANFPENLQFCKRCARNCARYFDPQPELARLVEGWASLPEPTRRAIVALAEIAGGDR